MLPLLTTCAIAADPQWSSRAADWHVKYAARVTADAKQMTAAYTAEALLGIEKNLKLLKAMKPSPELDKGIKEMERLLDEMKATQERWK